MPVCLLHMIFFLLSEHTRHCVELFSVHLISSREWGEEGGRVLRCNAADQQHSMNQLLALKFNKKKSKVKQV